MADERDRFGSNPNDVTITAKDGTVLSQLQPTDDPGKAREDDGDEGARPFDPVADKELFESVSQPVENHELWINDPTDAAIDEVENMTEEELEELISEIFGNRLES